MDRNRILQLALEELEKQKTEIDAEITEIRAELGETKTEIPAKVKSTIATVGGKWHLSVAARKAQSLRMKKYWAAKRAEAIAAMKPSLQKFKSEKTAVSKAISEAMRIYWAKKKANTAVKEASVNPSKTPKKRS